MKVALATTLTIEVNNKLDVILPLSKGMNNYFEDKQYGSDIKSYTIGIVCVSPQFEQFFKEKRPKYTKGKKVIAPDGIPFMLEDSFEYDIKIDFETFRNANSEDAKKILAKEILSSLSVLEKMKSKIKDFDIVAFEKDLSDFFKNENPD